jgi:EmrB/QacA subfamily drug resistance transporter
VPAQSTLGNQIVGRRRAWALAGVMLAQLISQFSSTVVANSGPTIADDLHGVSLYAWVFAGYTLAATICVPVIGRLSDERGRRVFYAAGLAVFFAGTVACGFARSMPELIAARFVAGIGGGAMLALGAATLGDIFPPRERARWLGLIMINYGVGSILGPILGGVVTDRFGWRWSFFMVAPPILIALVVITLALPRVRPQRRVGIDWLGIALLSGALTALIAAVTWGGVSYPWLSAPVVSSLAVATLLFALFGLHELGTPQPVMTPRLFEVPAFRAAVVLGFVVRMAFFGLLAFFPIYLQGVTGASPTASGFEMVPLMIAFVGGSALSGVTMSRSGRYRLSCWAGPLALLLGGGLSFALSASSPLLLVELAMAAVGFGAGIVVPLVSSVVQSAFPYRMLGTANSGRQFFDNLGQVIGTTVMTTITITAFTASLPDRLPPSARGALASVPRQGLLSSEGQHVLAARLATLSGWTGDHALATLRESLATGLHWTFALGLVLGAVALVAGIVMPQIPLRVTHEG